MNKKFMFEIMTLVILTSIVFSPAVVPTAPNRVVHGEKPAATAPVVNFSANPTSGLPPLQVGFTDESAGTPTGWAWYFGDEAFDEPWTQMATAIEWTGRSGHTSMVLPDGSIVLMGGYDGSYLNDVWRSTDQGATWTQMTAAAEWMARYGHTSVALPDGGIVLMGGVRYDFSRLGDVWRSTDQGATWTQMNDAALGWTKRFGHTSVALPDGSIVLMGGHFGENDVWRSTDQGATWTQMTPAAEWAARGGHTSVALPDDSIVLMGGENKRIYPNYVKFNDVWRSTDQGATWIQLTAAAEWLPRFDHTSVVLPDSSIVLMGGQYFFSDVWRSTNLGANWSTLPDELKIFLPLILH